MLADFLLDLVFGLDQRLRQRKLEIEAARQAQLREARAHLLEELASADRLRKGAP